MNKLPISPIQEFSDLVLIEAIDRKDIPIFIKDIEKYYKEFVLSPKQGKSSP